MIQLSFIPKSKTNDPYFTYNVQFSGDINKAYTCQVVDSNAITPRIVGFTTDDIGVNYVILEFVAASNNREMKVNFNELEQTEVEKAKFEFFKWFAGFFTWFDFIFKLVPVATLKKLVKIVFGVMVGVAIAGVLYSVTEKSYESITGEDFDDTIIMQVVESLTARNVSGAIDKAIEWFSEDGIDTATELKEYLGEKTEGIIDNVSDKIEDIKD